MKKLTMKSITSKISKLEGLKHEASIGDVKEILGLVSDFVYKYPSTMYSVFFVNGIRRARRKGKHWEIK